MNAIGFETVMSILAEWVASIERAESDVTVASADVE